MSRTTDAIIDQMNKEAKEPKWFLLIAFYGYDGDQEFIKCYSSKEEAEASITSEDGMYKIFIPDSVKTNVICDHYGIVDLREWVYQ